MGESKFADDLEKPISAAGKAASETAKELEEVGKASDGISKSADGLKNIGEAAETASDGATVLSTATDGLEKSKDEVTSLGTAFKGFGTSIIAALPAVAVISTIGLAIYGITKYINRKG